MRRAELERLMAEAEKLHRAVRDAEPSRRWFVDGAEVTAQCVPYAADVGLQFQVSTWRGSLSASGYERIAKLKRAVEQWMANEIDDLPPSDPETGEAAR